MHVVINLITEIKTVGLEAEEHKCGSKYCFINAGSGVDVNLDVNLNVDAYLGTEIKKGVVSDISKFLSSSVRHYSACCRIAVAVMIEICRNAISA